MLYPPTTKNDYAWKFLITNGLYLRKTITNGMFSEKRLQTASFAEK
jgi:hypothetical protein